MPRVSYVVWHLVAFDAANLGNDCAADAAKMLLVRPHLDIFGGAGYGVGTIEEQMRASSEFDVRHLVQAKYPGKYVRVVQVMRID